MYTVVIACLLWFYHTTDGPGVKVQKVQRVQRVVVAPCGRIIKWRQQCPLRRRADRGKRAAALLPPERSEHNLFTKPAAAAAPPSELFKEPHDEAVHKNSYKSKLYDLISASLTPPQTPSHAVRKISSPMPMRMKPPTMVALSASFMPKRRPRTMPERQIRKVTTPMIKDEAAASFHP